jgi:hypothetical protein
VRGEFVLHNDHVGLNHTSTAAAISRGGEPAGTVEDPHGLDHLGQMLDFD